MPPSGRERKRDRTCAWLPLAFEAVEHLVICVLELVYLKTYLCKHFFMDFCICASISISPIQERKRDRTCAWLPLAAYEAFEHRYHRPCVVLGASLFFQPMCALTNFEMRWYIGLIHPFFLALSQPDALPPSLNGMDH